ncbi:hypothetical protein PPERSA_02749 [Pseudocohnilembus persalinus]|uniref:Uncharacterized protein n=1 Tax=Pseudocohnilembus persalinus TaxID=266149 RepID=A0A0V0R771_PSEPJ|nr:hypothetical protein PPERSA_02749 [Pseudocohnilembus persalinus]|eukprot:KRX10332.1 hypothetical protein PPERSA_02749 [Pseudocohnilembus persalinus]
MKRILSKDQFQIFSKIKGIEEQFQVQFNYGAQNSLKNVLHYNYLNKNNYLTKGDPFKNVQFDPKQKSLTSKKIFYFDNIVKNQNFQQQLVSYSQKNNMQFEKIDLLNVFFQDLLKIDNQIQQQQELNNNVEDIYLLFFADSWLYIDRVLAQMDLPKNVNLNILGICPFKSYQGVDHNIEKQIISQIKSQLLNLYENLQINKPQVDKSILDLYIINNLDEILYLKKEEYFPKDQQEQWMDQTKQMYWIHTLKPFGLLKEQQKVYQIVEQLENKYDIIQNSAHFVLENYSPLYQKLPKDPIMQVLNYMTQQNQSQTIDFQQQSNNFSNNNSNQYQKNYS